MMRRETVAPIACLAVLSACGPTTGASGVSTFYVTCEPKGPADDIDLEQFRTLRDRRLEVSVGAYFRCGVEASNLTPTEAALARKYDKFSFVFEPSGEAPAGAVTLQDPPRFQLISTKAGSALDEVCRGAATTATHATDHACEETCCERADGGAALTTVGECRGHGGRESDGRAACGGSPTVCCLLEADDTYLRSPRPLLPGRAQLLSLGECAALAGGYWSDTGRCICAHNKNTGAIKTVASYYSWSKQGLAGDEWESSWSPTYPSGRTCYPPLPCTQQYACGAGFCENGTLTTEDRCEQAGSPYVGTSFEGKEAVCCHEPESGVTPERYFTVEAPASQTTDSLYRFRVAKAAWPGTLRVRLEQRDPVLLLNEAFPGASEFELVFRVEQCAAPCEGECEAESGLCLENPCDGGACEGTRQPICLCAAADGGTQDADGGSDAGVADAGIVDAGPSDAGPSDAGATDAGEADAGGTDAGATDAGTADAGTVDGGAPGDTCQTALPLTVGVPLTNQSAAGLINNYGPDQYCGGEAFQRDIVYSLVVPAGMQAIFTSSVPTVPLTVVPGPAANCGILPRVCAIQSHGTATYMNATASDQTVFAIADTTQTFDITATLATPATGDVCTTAEVLPVDGSTISGSTAGFRDDYFGGRHCGGVGSGNLTGPDRVYQAEVPAGTTLFVELTPFTFDGALLLIEGSPQACHALPVTCVDSAGGALRLGRETAAYANTGATSKTLYVIVDGNREQDVGTFALRAKLISGSTASPGDTCADATRLTPAPAVAVQTAIVGLANNYLGGTTCASSSMTGGDGVFVVSVPANKRLTAVVTDPSTLRLVSLVSGPTCAGPGQVCVGGRGGSGLSYSGTYWNSTGSAQDIFLVVDSFASSSQPFTLAVVLDDPGTVLPPAEACSAAPLATAGRVVGTLAGLSNDFSVSCGFGPGADGVYAVDVPPAATVRVAVIPIGSFNPGLSLTLPSGSCPGTCLGTVNSSVFDAEVLEWTNPAATTAQVTAILERSTNSIVDTFELQVDLRP